MSQFKPDKKHRNRRMSSDEAAAWARNLRLRNSLAKLVLHMLTGYVNGDGICSVGLPALSEDTELAQETVRRRLGWLEQIGAITRLPQWIDEHGQRNGEGRGRRTSDEIRLMIDADIDLIEARAVDDIAAEQAIAGKHDVPVDPVPGTGSDPLPQTGSTEAVDVDGAGIKNPLPDEKNLAWDSISPLATPSLRTGPDSLNLNRKDSPLPPLTGGDGPDASQGEESTWAHAESWARAESIWGEPVLHQSICRQIWSAFTETERERFLDVMRGYNAWRGKQKRPPNRCNLQKLMRERDAWPRFEALAPEKPKPPPPPKPEHWLEQGSAEHRALCVVAAIVRRSPPRPLHRPGGGCSVCFAGDVPVGAAAIAQLAEIDPETGEVVCKQGWRPVERGTAQYVAWSERVSEWTGRMPEGYRIWLDRDGNVVPTANEAYRKDERSLPRAKDGLLVPREWPPPKGTGKPKTETAADDQLQKTG